MKASLAEVLMRADLFFMRESSVHKAAQRITDALKELEIPFVVAGALAANAHGHMRTTQDVDILLTAEGLARFKNRWLGRGWVEIFPGSKGLRDVVNNVKIDVLLTGDYPGDGKPKEVVFPDPADVATLDSAGIPILCLKALIELKLASGMTAAHRPRDLDDVIQLIRCNDLASDYGEQLNPFVQEEYGRLWEAAQVSEDY